MKGNKQEEKKEELTTKVIEIKRVSKKTKGGNQIGFTALVAVGDHQGRLGVALAKAKDVSSAIRKAARRAEKILITIPLRGQEKTLPYPLTTKFKATRLLLKPAPLGTGLIAGGAARSILEVSGLENIVVKIFGSRRKTTVAYAVFKVLQQLSQKA